MVGTEGDEAIKPLAEPRLVQFLKNRPRLIDRGLRREFLQQLEMNIRERRKPDTMAEKTVKRMFEELEQAGGGVAKERTKRFMERANDGPLERL